jgi:hypothetical protein
MKIPFPRIRVKVRPLVIYVCLRTYAALGAKVQLFIRKFRMLRDKAFKISLMHQP